MDIKREDADIKAAVSAVASHAAGRYKRQLLDQMYSDLAPEIAEARMAGRSIDTNTLFLRLAEKYAN